MCVCVCVRVCGSTGVRSFSTQRGATDCPRGYYSHGISCSTPWLLPFALSFLLSPFHLAHTCLTVTPTVNAPFATAIKRLGLLMPSLSMTRLMGCRMRLCYGAQPQCTDHMKQYNLSDVSDQQPLDGNEGVLLIACTEKILIGGLLIARCY